MKIIAFEIMTFQEGCAGPNTAIVCKKSFVKNIDELLEKAFELFIEEYSWSLEAISQDDPVRTLEGFKEEFKDKIESGYVRYYPKLPVGGWEVDSGYTYCEKGRGAFEVWNIKIDRDWFDEREQSQNE